VKTELTNELTGVYAFEEFRLDAGKRLLFGPDGEPVPLMPKAFDILLYLLRNAERIVEKDELMDKIWPDTVVEENNLTQNISSIRKALGERHKENRFIATIPGRGYKFVAVVRLIQAAGGETQAVPVTTPAVQGTRP
jgi:DNA-binding winged helix-turn-helix (wHTH) protein